MSRALTLSLISISAALYAVAIAVTSAIPTPWGVGNFRPGVVIPAFFAVVFGPLIGGVGAAIGTFIGDFALSFFGLSNPLLSLIAGVPGNFFGFYLLGWLTSKRRSWSSFIANSFASLVVGNLIAAAGVVLYYWFVVPDWALYPLDLKMTILLGLTFFWVTTMIVFVLPLVPVLVAYIEPSMSEIGIIGIKGLRQGKPNDIVKSSIVVSAVLLVLYVLVKFVPGGNSLFAGVLPSELLLIAAVVVFIFGMILAFLARKTMKAISRR